MIILAILILFVLFVTIVSLNHIDYMNKQKNRVLNLEYNQRFVNNKRNGYNWGIK